LRLRIEKVAFSVFHRVLEDGDTNFAEREQAQALLQRLGG
jgi:hypothetical protein